jgi:ribokinase
MKKIVVIGSANVDMIMGLPRLPSRGETITDGKFMQTFGGKGANQAIAAQRAGAQVSLMTCLGKDDHGRAVARQLSLDGVDLSLTIFTAEAPTGTALVMFDSDGHNYLAVAPGSNYHLLPQHVEDASARISECSMLMLQCEIPEATIDAALLAAREHDIPVLFNCAPIRSPELKRNVAPNTGLVVNEIEASALANMTVTDTVSASKAARTLHSQGYAFAVVTLGAGGACFCSSEGEDYVPAVPVTAVDTTAAGDTFCGALAVALAECAPLRDGIVLATAAAALCVQRAGAQPSIPYREEIEIVERALREQIRTVKGEQSASISFAR